MGFLSDLFKRKEKKEVVERVSSFPVYPIHEDLMKTKSAIEHAKTMVDCKVASEKIDTLVGYFDVQPLRDELCDKTFDIFAKEYKKN
jgi:hypothetical protein